MSIIYDALQKTQRNREYLRLQKALTERKSHRRNLKWLVLSGCMVVGGVVAGAIFSLPILQKSTEAAHFWVTDAKTTAIRPPAPVAKRLPVAVAPVVAQVPAVSAPITMPPQAVSAALVTSKLTLNGVLISGSDKTALINNQAFHLGDNVEGMQVIGIEFNNVKLQKGTQTVELRISA